MQAEEWNSAVAQLVQALELEAQWLGLRLVKGTGTESVTPQRAQRAQVITLSETNGKRRAVLLSAFAED
jgi:hypothetical protein